MLQRSWMQRTGPIIVTAFTLAVIDSAAHAQRPGGMNPQMQQQMLQRFDTNGNGQLDPEERQAAQQFMQQMGGGMGMGGGRPPGGPGGGKPGGGGGPGGGMMNPQMRQQMMQQFDANGNGQLDPNEQQALQQFMQSRGMGMGGRPGGPGGPGGGKPGGGGGPGGGMMSPEMRQQMLQKFDTNGNGQLDPEERQAAQQFMQSRGMGMGGPPGAGGKGNGPKTGKVQPAATTKGKPDAASAAQDKQIQLLRFDKNGNGKLEPDELKAAREAAKE